MNWISSQTWDPSPLLSKVGPSRWPVVGWECPVSGRPLSCTSWWWCLFSNCVRWTWPEGALEWPLPSQKLWRLRGHPPDLYLSDCGPVQGYDCSGSRRCQMPASAAWSWSSSVDTYSVGSSGTSGWGLGGWQSYRTAAGESQLLSLTQFYSLCFFTNDIDLEPRGATFSIFLEATHKARLKVKWQVWISVQKGAFKNSL